ncbi:MAG: hypothetical protein JXO22_02775 [Phycisphaerae bacterium]|nr:hypothetical protein [Phycisphaerae bacterium]
MNAPTIKTWVMCLAVGAVMLATGGCPAPITPKINPDPNQVDPLVSDAVAVGSITSINVEALPAGGGVDITVGSIAATVVAVEGTKVSFTIPAGLLPGTHTVVAKDPSSGEVLATKSIKVKEADSTDMPAPETPTLAPSSGDVEPLVADPVAAGQTVTLSVDVALPDDEIVVMIDETEVEVLGTSGSTIQILIPEDVTAVGTFDLTVWDAELGTLVASGKITIDAGSHAGGTP